MEEHDSGGSFFSPGRLCGDKEQLKAQTEEAAKAAAQAAAQITQQETPDAKPRKAWRCGVY